MNLNSMIDMATTGTANIIPKTPKMPPPIIIDISTINGCSPVLSPRILGARILFSTH